MKDPAKKQQLLSSFDMPCHVCQEPSKSQCPSCRTPYCCKTCQRMDWKNGHKEQCKKLTKEFERGYAEGGLQPKKKDAPPVVVIPDNVKPTVDMKHTTQQAPKAAEDKAPSGRESCPICLEILPNENRDKCYLTCCGSTICTACAKMCLETNPICPLCRVPAARTDAEVIARLRRRVAKGDKVAQCNLGALYKTGQYGLKLNLTRAVQLYELSVAQGYVFAQYNLGNCYIFGHGVKMDKRKALKYYIMAAEQGHVEAQYNSGIMHLNGEGVEPDVEEGQRFLELSAGQGNLEAQEALEELIMLLDYE